MISEAMTDAIFSLESEDGNSPCSSPDGKGRSGPAPVRVSRSASPARAPGKRTPDTCGPLFTASSPSADLQQCLANRLADRLATNGSPEYALTWKDQDMPWGPPICRLRASGRRISDSVFGGWPTPDASVINDSESLESFERRRVRLKRNGAGRPLAIAAKMAGWVSPTAQDGERGSAPPRAHDTGVPLSQQVAGWATPRVTTNGGNGNPERAADGKARLEDQVHGWATPTAPRKHDSDHSAFRYNPNKMQDDPVMQLLGRDLNLSNVPMEKRGALAPEFSRWLMGFPAGWENYADSATP